MNLPAISNELYPVVRRWLERDLEGRTLQLTQAYADLMFAFVLAKAGERDHCERLCWAAERSLGPEDPIQVCLCQAFRFRIGQQWDGHPHAGMLPRSVLSLAESGRMRRYAVDRMRHQSRILEPEYRVDAYWPFRREDKMARFINAWKGLEDPLAIEDAIRSALSSGGEDRQEGLIAEALRFAPLLGKDYSSNLLDRAILRIELGDRKGVHSLVLPSLTLAGELRDPRQIWPLVRVAAQWVTAWNPSEQYRQRFTETVTTCTQALAELGLSLESEEWADQTYAAIWGSGPGVTSRQFVSSIGPRR